MIPFVDGSVTAETLVRYWPVVVVGCVVLWVALREMGPIRRLNRLLQ